MGFQARVWHDLPGGRYQKSNKDRQLKLVDRLVEDVTQSKESKRSVISLLLRLIVF